MRQTVSIVRTTIHALLHVVKRESAHTLDHGTSFMSSVEVMEDVTKKDVNQDIHSIKINKHAL